MNDVWKPTFAKKPEPQTEDETDENEPGHRKTPVHMLRQSWKRIKDLDAAGKSIDEIVSALNSEGLTKGAGEPITYNYVSVTLERVRTNAPGVAAWLAAQEVAAEREKLEAGRRALDEDIRVLEELKRIPPPASQPVLIVDTPKKTAKRLPEFAVAILTDPDLGADEKVAMLMLYAGRSG
jgi:hypothetical protein